MVTVDTTIKELKLETVILTIDGQEVEAPKGTTVLEAARSAGIYIPTLCYDPDLTPYGGCRLCIVDIEGIACVRSPDLPVAVRDHDRACDLS